MRSSTRRFLTGKVPVESLMRIVFRYAGIRSPRVLLGPAIGEDAAIVEMDDKVLVLTTDPITGAQENIGWLSVHINANDVASRGARPLWYLPCLLLPEKADERLLEGIMRQVDRAARELRIAVIGGHSEVTPGLDRPIVVGFMAGEAAKNAYVTTRGAKTGDNIILTKTAGLEGTAILAADLEQILRTKLSQSLVGRAKRFIRRISVVQEAMAAVNTGGVDALHDPTEGGVLTGLWELAAASKSGMTVHESSIPIASETKTICAVLGLDPLRIMSSGALLIVARPDRSQRIVESIRRRGITASMIGMVEDRRKGRVLVSAGGKRVRLEPAERDELYKALERYKIRID